MVHLNTVARFGLRGGGKQNDEFNLTKLQDQPLDAAARSKKRLPASFGCDWKMLTPLKPHGDQHTWSWKWLTNSNPRVCTTRALDDARYDSSLPRAGKAAYLRKATVGGIPPLSLAEFSPLAHERPTTPRKNILSPPLMI